MTNVQIRAEPIATLAEQASVSIAYEYDRVLDLTVVDGGLGGFVLNERKLEAKREKDYDAIDGERPSSWAGRFDLSNWGFIVARINGQRVGGAVIAFNTAGIDMLEGRDNLAVLWDIRVDRNLRGQGVGAALFDAAARWAVERGCVQMKVETQNVNIEACKFYAGRGCTLGAISRFAYVNLPDEIQMLWYKELS